MDTAAFFAKVLPRRGFYALAVFNRGLAEPPQHRFYDDVDTMAEAAVLFSARATNVYHACASFAEHGSRKAANARNAGSLWLDLDVGKASEAKSYRTQVDALHDIYKFVDAVGLPQPLVVSSGVGLHCYWPFTHDIGATEWKLLSEKLAAALDANGVKHDATRTSDLASILRPVGTVWAKTSTKPVTLITDAEPTPPAEIEAALDSYNRVAVPEAVQRTAKPQIANPFAAALPEYPPSHATEIIRHCAALSLVADKKGDVPEPLWRAMLGVVKHTVEGAGLAHEWSRGYAGYSADETQDKLERWNAAPTTCAEFRRHTDVCADCSQTVTSPIALGYAAAEPPAVEPPKAAQSVVEVDPLAGVAWPPNIHWNGAELCYMMRNDDGVITPVSFSDTLFYPTTRVEAEDGTWLLQMRMQVRKGEWRDFGIPTESISDPRSLCRALAAYEVIIYPKKAQYAMLHVQNFTKSLKDSGTQIRTYHSLGWHNNYEEFLLGSEALCSSGVVSPIMLSSGFAEGASALDSLAAPLGVAGTVREWSEAVDAVYNREHVEPYQFLFYAAFGAPLVALLGNDEWHGIPIAVTGESGLGKTAVCSAAISIYGDPRRMKLDVSNMGATMLSVQNILSKAKNLPLIFDEVTGRDPEQLRDLMYSVANGRKKTRSTASGSTTVATDRWYTQVFVTGQNNLHGELHKLKAAERDAVKLRVFESSMDRATFDAAFKGINSFDDVGGKFSQLYGAVGRQYLLWVMKNRESVVEGLNRLMSKYAPSGSDSAKRFYIWLVVTALLGGKIATKLGYLNFDYDNIKTWAFKQIDVLSADIAETAGSLDDQMADFVNWLLDGRTIVTKHFGDSRTAEELPVLPIRNTVRARIARDERRFLVSLVGAREWCAKVGVDFNKFKRDITTAGYRKESIIDKAYLGQGTPYRNVPQQRCWEISYAKTSNMGFDAEVVPESQYAEGR